MEKSNIYFYILCGKVYKMSNLFHDAQGGLGAILRCSGMCLSGLLVGLIYLGSASPF